MACRDRATWRRVVEGARRVAPRGTEILVVDWGSRRHRVARGNWTTLRVDGVDAWNLAQAYNLGFEHAAGTHVLKLDCDTRLACMPPRPAGDAFDAGSWRTAGHLNGVFYAPRALLRRVGGYDERLARYGWDDSDLYRRLAAAGAARGALTCASHMDHGARERGVAGAVEAEILTQEHRLCLGDDPRGWWNASRPRAAYRQLYNRPGRLVRVWHPRPIEETSRACDRRHATGKVLHKLFRACRARGCNGQFWSVVKARGWDTPREAMMLLAPTHVDHALWCLGNWTSFVNPASVRACGVALRAFDAYVRARSAARETT